MAGPVPLPAKILKPAKTLGPTQDNPQTAAASIRSETAQRGHNVFRPDVYRVSEGYLN